MLRLQYTKPGSCYQWLMVIFTLLWSCSHACDLNQTCDVDMNNENIKSLLASMEYFTIQCIQRAIYNKDLNTNFVISPMSMFVVAVLLLFGSAGDVQKELKEALHFPDTDLEQLKQSFADILNATEAKRSEMVDGEEVIALEGHIMKGLFVQKDFAPVDAYVKFLSSLYMESQPVDFANSMNDALKAIVEWTMDNKAKIQSIAFTFTSAGDTRIYMNSMFYLTAKWVDNIFLDIVPGTVPFNTLQDGKVDVQMMKTAIPLFYYDNGDSYSAVEIGYAGGDFTADFFLPHDGVDAVEFVTKFTMDILNEFLSKGTNTNLDCQIPIFKCSHAVGINDLFQGVGVKQLFGEADLSNMLQADKQNFGVLIQHINDILVNEKGTMAETLHVVPIQKDPPAPNPTKFIANRPFLMLVRSTHTKAIVLATFFTKV